MAEDRWTKLDAALSAMGRSARDRAPRPRADLVARVLADAASASGAAGRRAPSPGPAPRRRGGRGGGVLGWLAGPRIAVAVLLLVAFAAGLGAGYRAAPGGAGETLALDAEADLDGALMADAGLF